MDIPSNAMNIIMMIIVGAIAGTLAARIVKRNNFGFLINSLLGIAGAIVGGYLFNLLNLTPGVNIVKMIDQTFGVALPLNFVGMLVSSTVGAIIILIISNIFQKRKN